MKFLTGQTQAAAVFISETLYDLSRPQSVTQAGDVTSSLLPILGHPGRPEWAVGVPEEPFPIPLHPDRNPAPLIEAFADSISPDELAFFQSIAGMGVTLDLADIIPQAVRDRLRTETDLTADGWFSRGAP
jgi:hypothetical protein